MTSPGSACLPPPNPAAPNFQLTTINGYVFGPNAAGATVLFTVPINLDRGIGLLAFITFCAARLGATPRPIQLTFNGAASRTAAGVTAAVSPSVAASTAVPSLGVLWTSLAPGFVSIRCHAAGSPAANVTIAYLLTEKTPP
ncbi:MAG TPA: hypothetical protein VFO62_07515 [Candidatus Binatia bacterium]|nr:hypothetical protein [Candidatus Binatia bacterium]